MALGIGAGQPDLLPAKVLLAAGLVLVLFSRGCDTVLIRRVKNAQAGYDRAVNRLRDRYEEKIAKEGLRTELREIDEERAALRKEEPDFAERREQEQKLTEREADIREHIARIEAERDARKEYLDATEWLSRRYAAQRAAARARRWGYWSEWAFLVGSLGLMFGSVLVGFGGTGTERVAALVLVAIITFSIYVAGTAWVVSAKKTVEATAQSKVSSSPAGSAWGD